MPKDPQREGPTSEAPPQDVLTGLPAELFVTNVEGIKAMADPLRVSILKALYAADADTGTVPARTARQLCEELGETRTTRIYHHLKLLLGAGLIQKVWSARRANLVEDYFGPSARLIRLSPDLLESSRVGDDPVWVDSIFALLDTTRRDLRALAPETPINALTYSHREFKLSTKSAAAFRSELVALLSRYEALDEEGPDCIRALALVYPAPAKD